MKTLSKQQVQKLKELGVDTSNIGFKVHSSKRIHAVCYGSIIDGYLSSETIEMITLEDVFDLLPKEIIIKKVSYQLNWNPLNGSLRYDNIYGDEGTILYGCSYIEEEGILYAAYNLLVWALENKYVKPNK